MGGMMPQMGGMPPMGMGAPMGAPPMGMGAPMGAPMGAMMPPMGMQGYPGLPIIGAPPMYPPGGTMY